MCHRGVLAERHAALQRDDIETASALAYRIASTPASTLQDLQTQIALLVEVQDPASMHQGSLEQLLLFAIDLAARRAAAGKLPID